MNYGVSYIVRRLVRAILLLIGASALCFLFTEMAPGSFFDELRLNPQISPETISAIIERARRAQFREVKAKDCAFPAKAGNQGERRSAGPLGSRFRGNGDQCSADANSSN